MRSVASPKINESDWTEGSEASHDSHPLLYEYLHSIVILVLLFTSA